ncbi:RsmB/NOP family class I SAM-dependent RNA methyltransferase [Amphiplicatus metriothermophilus]|uniref:16S rRNA (Cytosine967-C5)-methyltransferase n=1 Tax=Amphiplicatus metriothermophilus TaxID=1519374 RepID=A0A239Q102_9PROT|nr:RsmB/NOP family class I SAM-dependent RNA methyltransferase [Amphiplicatus metriothermophilus]MBB5519728.1 16S rRNA (cytosine967-C5)-methyltransferase [Amphiplicatus metriothermophilus]SNT75933.1 16S rRNA (cytosine967-C5)-methyltransferase [Amphiplicatus metriothermophilus]
MRLSGRVSAAIEILTDFDARRVPLKTAMQDWARGARYAGAKDRAWISGLCLDALRRRASLVHAMDADSPRALVLGALRFVWGASADEIAALAAEEPHGPGALSAEEEEKLRSSRCGPESGQARAEAVPPHVAGDFPAWTTPMMVRAFGQRAAEEGAALAARADVDLRINTLKTTPEKALAALKAVKGEALPLLTTAARINAPDPREKVPAVTVIPAFNRGWVEVQDLGSQIAAAAAGAVRGAQVLDFCAGGGGKTLALAALMENTSQLYAWDRDARRLKPLYHRAKRAGARNLQIINPVTDKEALAALAGRMDVVFVDAPCTGSGVWRRHPDAKWRLAPDQLERRMKEQDAVLAEAARFVKPGGRLVYVTCSLFMEENEDRLAAFLEAHPGFARTRALDALAASGLLTKEGRAALARCETPDGALRVTPARISSDGFFVATLQWTR